MIPNATILSCIVTLFIRNEAVTFLVVEPFNCTFVHNDTSTKNKKIMLSKQHHKNIMKVYDCKENMYFFV